MSDFQRTSPSNVDVDSAGILAFIDEIERDLRVEPHGLIIQRHGQRIAEGYWAPHTPDRSRLVYSVSKTFTGTALGLMIGEGCLGLDDLVSDHLPEFLADADERTRRMTIRHIATMATGHDRETLLEARQLDPENPVRGFFQIRPDAEPGTLFCYNQPPVLALATILTQLAGEGLVSYLRPRLFDPIGIGDLRWAQDHRGVDLGFSGVHTNLDAVARLGQLYLDDGVWEGQRILPEGWVAEAARVHIPNPQREEPDWQQGYGIQLWRSRHGYRGDGAFGQYMVVLPEHDAVVAMFSCTEHMQVVLDAMWTHLLPAFGSRTDPGLDSLLLGRLADLMLPAAADHDESSGTGSYGPGLPGLNAHRTITRVDFAGDRLVIHEDDSQLSLPLGDGWQTSDENSVAVSVTRLADGSISADLVFLETPHRLGLRLDPATMTFTSTWPAVPLFAAGISSQLSAMRAPA